MDNGFRITVFDRVVRMSTEGQHDFDYLRFYNKVRLA